MESNEKTYIFSEKTLDSYVKTVQKIARLEEREACAKIVGDMPIQYERDGHYVLTTPEDYEAAIRARGQA
jgi:hypothetical protein